MHLAFFIAILLMQTGVTQRGVPFLVHENYVYRKSKPRDPEDDSYRCMDVTCERTGHFNENGPVGRRANHICVRNPEMVGRYLGMAQIRRQVQEQPASELRELYEAGVQYVRTTFGVASAATMPSFRSMETGLRRRRRLVAPANPVDAFAFWQVLNGEVPVVAPLDPFRLTKDRQRFYLLGGHSAEGTFVIFATDADLLKMCEARRLFMDGTFKVLSESFLFFSI